MTVKLLSKHHLEFLSVKGSCTDSSESTLVKISHCWKSRVTAHIIFWYLSHLENIRSLSGAFAVRILPNMVCDEVSEKWSLVLFNF